MGRLQLDDAVLARLDALVAKPAGHRFGILGLGVSGRAMALHLARRGAQVTAADLRADVDRSELEAAGVTLSLGTTTAHTFDGAEALALTPGADPRQPAVQAVLASGRPVCGELDVAGPLPARVAAITGTNGKSTTTSLLGALVRAHGLRAFVGGNLGDPVVAWLDRKEPADVAVLELSSFQLETAYRFSADVGVVLNVTPDHYDRYENIEAYAHAKARLVEGVKPGGVAVLNADDPYAAAMAKNAAGRVWWFSSRAAGVPDGATLAHDELLPHGALAGLGRLALAHPRLIGRHNRENALAALLAAYALGVHDARTLARGYQNFAGLEHRLEMVAEVGGVLYINDSKATNDDAAAVALAAIERPVVLLAGGRDKGGGYQRTVQAAARRVRLVVAFGEARSLIAQAFEGHHDLRVCTTFREAFAEAAAQAQPGEAVLLAPACASFDEFNNYAERGRAFKALVAERRAGAEPGGDA